MRLSHSYRLVSLLGATLLLALALPANAQEYQQPAPTYPQQPAYQAQPSPIHGSPAAQPYYAAPQQPMYAAPAPAVAAQPRPEAKTRSFRSMAGRFGIGLGVGAATNGDSMPAKMLSEVAFLRYNITDSFGIEPGLVLHVDHSVTDYKNVDGGDKTSTNYDIAPRFLLLFTPYIGMSTRLNIGAGLGLSFDGTKNVSGVNSGDSQDIILTKTTIKTSNIGLDLPVTIGIEHFFADWFSINVGFEFNLLSYSHNEGERQVSTSGTTKTVKAAPIDTVSFDIDSTKLMVGLGFYID